jgi:hypothetical protein
MALEHLTEDERCVVLGCLRAVVSGPFFPDWEYHTLFGLERSEVADILSKWQELPESREEVFVGINNAMNNLLLWFGWQSDSLEEGVKTLQFWTGTSPEAIERVYHKWLAGRRGGLA